MEYRLKQKGSEVQSLLDKIDQLPLEKGKGDGSVQNTTSEALGDFAIALGSDNSARGVASFAEGGENTVSGLCSHVEGSNNITVEDYVHVEGYNNLAKGKTSHIEGAHNTTENTYEHAEGSFNKSNKGHTLHSIGIGSNIIHRKNAWEVLRNGKAFLYEVGGYDGTNAVDKNNDGIAAKTLQQELSKIADPFAGVFCLKLGKSGTLTEEEVANIREKLAYMLNSEKFFLVSIYDDVDKQFKGDCEIIRESSQNSYLIMQITASTTPTFIMTTYTFYENNLYSRNQYTASLKNYSAGAGIAIDKDRKISCTIDTTIFRVVDSLPESPVEGDENKIHLVKESTVEGDLFSEYLWVEEKWEKLGAFRPTVDLTDYANLKKNNTFSNNNTFVEKIYAVNGIQLNNGTSGGPIIINSDEENIEINMGYGSQKANINVNITYNDQAVQIGSGTLLYAGNELGYDNHSIAIANTIDDSPATLYGIKVPENPVDDTCAVNKAYVDEELAKKLEFNEDPNFNNIHCNAIEIGTDDVIDSGIGTYVDRSDGTYMGVGIIVYTNNQSLQPLFVGAPTRPNMAATKAYVDNLISQMQTTIDTLTQRVADLETALNEISYVEEETATTSETSK